MIAARVEISFAHAEDIASLANAAGLADSPTTLQDMVVTVDDDYVTFGVTDARVAVLRRGTHGEFGGSVWGEGAFAVHARRFAKILRLAARETKKIHPSGHIELWFNEGSLTVGGVPVMAYGNPIRPNRIVDLVQPLLIEDGARVAIDGHLPIFNLRLLHNLTAAAGKAPRLAQMMRVGSDGSGRWGFASANRDSWVFAGVLMETRS